MRRKKTCYLVYYYSNAQVHINPDEKEVSSSGKSYHGSDETLVFWRFTGEAVADEANFGDHSLPGLLLSLSGSDDFKHFCFSLGTNLWQGHFPLTLQKT